MAVKSNFCQSSNYKQSVLKSVYLHRKKGSMAQNKLFPFWIFTGTAGPDFLALLQSGGLLPQTLGPPPALPLLGGRNQGPPLSAPGGGGPPPPLSAPGGGGQAANLAFDLFKNMPPPMGGSSLPPGFENLTTALGGGMSTPPPLPALPNSAISVEDLERNFVSNIQEPKVSVIWFAFVRGFVF